MTNRIPPSLTPILAGLLIFSAGMLIRRYQPEFLNMPQPMQRAQSARDRFMAGDRLEGLAVGARDGLLMLLPRNFMDWLGRGLITMGGALAAAKLLDLAIDDTPIDELTDI